MEDRQRLSEALSDRYRIEREIGAGGMATVYLATDLRHERKVALKVLRSDLAATLGAERFLQEVRVTANLQHPHILPLFDSGEADGFLFYVMPFVDGESLRDRLTRERELPVPDAARLLRDVVDALAAAHKLGVVHRDIKPENVLISGRHAMVADFGVAKALSEATGRHKLTTVGVALGTPAYMAPEQAAAEEAIDHRADVYAVGAMAYELLTGRPPFTGGTAQQVLAAQAMETPQPVTELRPSVPPEFEALIMRCLEKKPADRWQSAEEMLPHLETMATPSGGMTPAGLVPARRARRPAWRRPLVWMAGGALAVAAVFGGYLLFGKPGGPASNGGPASEQAPGSAAATIPEDSVRVAVFPFENRTGDPEDDRVGSMVADGVSRLLDQSGMVRVVPSTTVRNLLLSVEDSATVPAVELARRAGATHAVMGSISIVGGTLQFEGEILDVRTGNLVLALDPLTGSPDSLEIQTTRAAQATAAATAWAARTTSDMGNPMFKSVSPPPTMDALEALESAGDAFNQSQWSRAIEPARRAISLAPEWPLPRLLLLAALSNLGRSAEADSLIEDTRDLVPSFKRGDRLNWELQTASQPGDRFAAVLGLFELYPEYWGTQLAMEALSVNQLERAREGVEALDFDIPGTQRFVWSWHIAISVYHLLGEDQAALSLAQRARSLFPKDHLLIMTECRPLAGVGDTTRVLALADTVRNLPADVSEVAEVLVEMGLELRVHGHTEASVGLLEEALHWAEATPGVQPFRLAEIQYFLHHFEAAFQILEGLANEDPSALHLGYLALTLDGLGRVAEADSVMARVEREFPATVYPALLAARRGDVRGAVTHLQACFDAGTVDIDVYLQLHRDPELEPIRDHPLFQALMRPSG